MNFKFKFNLGDKVVVPYLIHDSKATGEKGIDVVGWVESIRIYRDKSILVLVRWGAERTIHSEWFVEKELKVPKDKPKPRPKPKPKPKPRRATYTKRRIL